MTKTTKRTVRRPKPTHIAKVLFIDDIQAVAQTPTGLVTTTTLRKAAELLETVARRYTDLFDELKIAVDELSYIASEAVLHVDINTEPELKRSLRSAANELQDALEEAEKALEHMERFEDHIDKTQQHLEEPAETRARSSKRMKTQKRRVR